MEETQNIKPESQAESKPTRNKKDNNFLAISILVAGVLISGSVIYAVTALSDNGGLANLGANIGGTPSLPTPSIEDEPILGDKNAPVTMIEYSDFQCPFCGRFFSQTLPLIKENYIDKGKVKLVYKDLAFLGPESAAAAEAANCAMDEDKFWEFHDRIFKIETEDGIEHNGNLNRELFVRLADELGLNRGDFESCLDSRKYSGEVAGDVEEAYAFLSRVSTPSFFINGRPLSGALPYAQFADVIDAALAEAGE